jgi:hypothetical protein
MGAVVVDLLFFCAAGIERFQPVGNQSRPAVYKWERKKKIKVMKVVDLYAGLRVDGQRKAIQPTGTTTTTDAIH